MENNKSRIGITFSFSTTAFILFVVFLILKLCGVIAWAWVFVCLPLIITAGLWVLMFIVVIVCAIIAALTE